MRRIWHSHQSTQRGATRVHSHCNLQYLQTVQTLKNLYALQFWAVCLLFCFLFVFTREKQSLQNDITTMSLKKSGFALHKMYEKHYENVKYIVTHSKISHSHLFNLQFSHTGSSCWRHIFLILAVRRCLLVLNLRLLRPTLGNSSG